MSTQCPKCGTDKEPLRVDKPNGTQVRCSACNHLIRREKRDVPIQPASEGEIPMARRNPNDPPSLETTEPQPTMPEQVYKEPDVGAPPTLETETAPPKPEDEKRPLEPNEQDWYQICRRVKRIGGFVKGISKREQDVAVELMKKYDTKPEDGWKFKPSIPHFDQPHEANQKAIFEKPVKMIQVTK